MHIFCGELEIPTWEGDSLGVYWFAVAITEGRTSDGNLKKKKAPLHLLKVKPNKKVKSDKENARNVRLILGQFFFWSERRRRKQKYKSSGATKWAWISRFPLFFSRTFSQDTSGKLHARTIPEKSTKSGVSLTLLMQTAMISPKLQSLSLCVCVSSFRVN